MLHYNSEHGSLLIECALILGAVAFIIVKVLGLFDMSSHGIME